MKERKEGRKEGKKKIETGKVTEYTVNSGSLRHGSQKCLLSANTLLDALLKRYR
jgi:hypothetical protein